MKKPPITIMDAVTRDDVFAPWFRNRASFAAWFAFLKVFFGLPLDETELAIFRKHTGRNDPAPGGYFDATLIIGRRGGKSLILALVAAYLAAFSDWKPFLTGGEAGYIIVVAADRRQATVIFNYLREMLGIPLLNGIIRRETNELLELQSGIVIEVVTANFRTIRGRTVVAALADELAFWTTDEAGASPDKEVIAAVKPAMLTVPGARLLKASSPYARRGVLWDDHRKHFGKNSANLVWQASTEAMNPGVSADFIKAAYEDDEASAAAEYGGQFRLDIENFVSREVVESCVVPGRYELAPLDSISYYGFCDPSGGSNDGMTLCISHRENDRVVVDLLREVSPPFSPAQVVAEFSTLVKRYGLSTITSDRYAGAWVAEAFRAQSIQCNQAAKPKSDLYKDLLSVLNSGGVELLDNNAGIGAKAVNQICGLERRTARGGRDSIDHPPSGHDDLANATAGAVVGCAIPQGGAAGWVEYYRRRCVAAGINPDIDLTGSDLDAVRASGPKFGWSIANANEPLHKVWMPLILASGIPDVRFMENRPYKNCTRSEATDLLQRPAVAALNAELCKELGISENTKQ